MTSQPGQQTIAIHILANISRSKSNQTIKLGQLIEYNKRNIFAQKIRDVLNFNFSEKGLGLVSPPHFAYDF